MAQAMLEMDLDIIAVVVLVVIVEVGCTYLFLMDMTKLRLINLPCSFPSKNDDKVDQLISCCSDLLIENHPTGIGAYRCV
eukprot:13535446-Ditylum_brightwellii.AAC.1